MYVYCFCLYLELKVHESNWRTVLDNKAYVTEWLFSVY